MNNNKGIENIKIFVGNQEIKGFQDGEFIPNDANKGKFKPLDLCLSVKYGELEVYQKPKS